MKLTFNLKQIKDSLDEIHFLDDGENILIFDFSLGDKVTVHEVSWSREDKQFLSSTGFHNVNLYEDDWWCLDNEFSAEPHPDPYLRKKE